MPTTNKIYLLPGLGFTCAIFKKLQLADYQVIELNWIEPKTNESIQNYAARMAAKIEKTTERIVLIGHSFGGILAQEIAAIRKVDLIILVSSIRSRQEMPMQFKIVKPLAAYRFFTKEMTIKTLPFWGKNHGYETEKEQTLVRKMVSQYSNYYLQWALRTLSLWDVPDLPKSTKIVQIHGKNDKTFPAKKLNKVDFWLADGTHFMIYKQASIIEPLLLNIMKTIP